MLQESRNINEIKIHLLTFFLDESELKIYIINLNMICNIFLAIKKINHKGSYTNKNLANIKTCNVSNLEISQTVFFILGVKAEDISKNAVEIGVLNCFSAPTAQERKKNRWQVTTITYNKICNWKFIYEKM